MKIVDGEMWFTKKEVAGLVNRSALMIHYYDSWSNEREEEGEDRLIPKPRIIGKYRYWNKDDVEKIREFTEWVENNRGAMAGYSRRLWSKKEEEEK